MGRGVAPRDLASDRGDRLLSPHGLLPSVAGMDQRPDPDPLATFLVERYWPEVDLALVRAALPRLEAVAREMTAEGTRVEHLVSILMPVDRVVFSLIAAGDEGLVRELNARADLPADRIARAIALRSPGPGPAEDNA